MNSMGFNISQATKLIEAADKLRSEIVLCLMGKPGIGKTEAVERFAREHDRKVVHIIASQILPNEVSGMTMPNQETHTMDVFDHVRLGHMEDGDILFFDELLKGQTQVLNACLTLIQERRMMSGKKLPDILIVAAANPLATPAKLPPEIRQRFMFVDMEWSRVEWRDYMKAKGFSNARALDEMAELIKKSLDGDWSRLWNVLTPRTATKLCEWYREAAESGEHGMINAYIEGAYNLSTAKAVERVVDIEIVKRRKAMAAIVQAMIKEVPADRYADVIEGMREDMNKYVDDMSFASLHNIMEMLKAMDEWPEIQKALANEKVI